MSNKKIKIITHSDIQHAAGKVAAEIAGYEDSTPGDVIKLYGIPRGGVAAVYAVASHLVGLGYKVQVIDQPEAADYFVDDIQDSGATAERFQGKYGKNFFSLFFKGDSWLVFPWERNDAGADTSADDIGLRFLQRIGEDVNREGLRETPQRFIKALDEKFSGYKQNPADVLKAFADGAEGATDGLVIVSGIPVYSTCEHHLETIFGTATIGYIPRWKIVGLSKMKRLVDVFAKRLQVQERLTNQIADALVQHLDPLGVGVVLRARHMCMEARGIRCAGSETTTSALRGALLNNQVARQEFMELV